jgi:acyl carrier protein
MVLDEGRVEPGFEREEFEAWDSLKHVELIFAIEDAFDVRIAEDDLAELDGEASILEAIERARAA